MSVTELKKLCRDKGISGYSRFNKKDLVAYILKELKKSSKKSKTPSPKTPSPKKSHGGTKKKGCRHPDGCDTKKKSGYSVEQIRKLAQECNLTIKGKTRKQLCKEIAAALKKGGHKPKPPPPPPSPGPGPGPGPSGRKICKSKSGKPYSKGGCTRYGADKGCLWDSDTEECYMSGTPKPAPPPPPPPPPSPGPGPGPSGRKICKAKSGKPYNKSGCTRYGADKGCLWDSDTEECYMSGTPGPSPPPSPGPPPGECYGGDRRDLIKKKSKELRVLLEAAGIKEGRPQAKVDLINYLCALGPEGHGQRCDPAEGEFCDGDLVCDAKAKLCLPPDAARARSRLKEMEWNGKKIIGTQKALDRLREKLGKATPPPPPPGPTPGEQKRKKQAEEDRRKAEEDRRKAEEDRRKAEEDRRLCDEGYMP